MLPGKKRWYLITVIVLLILFRILRSVFATDEIIVASVERADLVQETRVAGDVIAQEDALLGFGVSGRITELFFEVGDMVEEGELLGMLDPQSASAEFSLAQANVNRERAQLNDLLDGNREEEIIIQRNILKVQEEEVALALDDVLRETLVSQTAAENAIRLKTNNLFRDPEGYAKLNFSTDLDNRKFLEEERRDFDLLFKKWLKYNETIDRASFNPREISGYAIENLKRINAFLVGLTQAVSEAADGTISETQKQNLDSARASVDAQITDLQNAYLTYQKVLAEQKRQESELALVEAGASSGEIATQQARLQAEQARLQQASSSVFDTKIVAPFTGTITEQLYEVGETVSSGVGVIGIATLDSLELESFIPEVFIGGVTVGDRAFFSLDAYPNRSIEASVISVDPKQTDRDGLATYKTLLEIQNIDDLTLRLGMTSDITIITDTKVEALSLPLEFIIFENNQVFVDKKVGESYERVPIEVGIIDPQGRQEVVSGLQEGDKVKRYE